MDQLFDADFSIDESDSDAPSAGCVTVIAGAGYLSGTRTLWEINWYEAAVAVPYCHHQHRSI